MKEGTPSRTAAWVALARGMAQALPAEARLAEDPYGAAFEEGHRAKLHRVIERVGLPVHKFPFVTPWILYMQVRTRVIDDAVRAFVTTGGRQIVLLGAGYDTRALRMPELAGCRVFEIDHPATQTHKRTVLDRLGAVSPARYLTWNFEARPMSQLPDALAAAGLDRDAPTLTIWEGVTMYLTEPAIDASLRAIRAWSPPGSKLAMMYFARSRIEEPSPAVRLVKSLVARAGEPFTWGWNPRELPPYLESRGFVVEADTSMTDAARVLLPERYARQVHAPEQRIAIAASR